MSRFRVRNPARFAALAVVLMSCLHLSGAAPARSAEPPRVVAIGDVHGAYDPLVAILRQTGLVDHRLRWSGGDAILVQTGDMIDRGARSFEVVDLLMRLQEEAPESGGRVVVLLGNHELLNLLGDFRDVTPEILEKFVDGRSEIRRKALLEEHEAVLRRRAEALGQEPRKLDRVGEFQFLSQHPAGLAEYAEAIGPEGKYGRWFRELPTIERLGDVIFVHGGLSPEMTSYDFHLINRTVRAEIATLDNARFWLLGKRLILPTADVREMIELVGELSELGGAATPPPAVREILGLGDWLMVRSDGPFWFRGYAKWSEEEGHEALPKILEAFGNEYFVAGHTPQKTGSIQERFSGRVFLIDTGMLESVYRGRPAALEIEGGKFTAVYLGEEDVIRDPQLMAGK